MKLNPYIQKLSDSKEYKSFQKKNSDAFLVAGFFVLDIETGQKLHQIDYYVPSQKKIAAFSMDRNVSLQILGLVGSKVPDKLGEKTKIDIDSLQGILEDEMKNRSITEDIKKIIAVVQNVDGKTIWNLNCILSGMSILNAHIDDDSETVLKMEKKSIMDIARAVPVSEFKKQMRMHNPDENPESKSISIKKSAEESVPSENEDIGENMPSEQNELKSYTKQEALERIKKLNMLESTIKEEKEFLAKSTREKPKGKKSSSKKPEANKK